MMPEIDLHGVGAEQESAVPGFFSAQILTGRRFFRPIRGRAAPIEVTSAGCERVSRDYHIHRKRFAYYGLEFVAAGTGTLQIGRRTERLLPGTIFCYGPATVHDIRTDPENRLVKYFVDATGRGVGAMLRQCNLPPGSIVRTAGPSEVMPIFDDLIRSGLRVTEWTGRICRSLFQSLLYKIAESAVAADAAAGLAFGTYQRCREALVERAMRIQSIRELAEECGVGEAYLCRLFKRYDDETPYRKLIRLKMQEAAVRLQRSAVTIKELAAEFGFADQYHFSRAFKRTMGMAPSRVR